MGKPRKPNVAAFTAAAQQATSDANAEQGASTPKPGNIDSTDQPLLSHLLELRDRLLRIVICVLVLFVIQIPFAAKIFGVVAMPLVEQLSAGSNLIATGAAAPFLTPFKMIFVTSMFLSIPVILYQIWLFVAPGLYTHERRMALPLVAGGTILFYLGALFAWFVVLPLFFGFMARLAPEQFTYMPDISSVLDVMLKLFMAFGFAFQVPIAIILLIYARAVEVAKLRQWRPYIFLGCFVIGMLLTPPDLISQTLLALPMYVLFELGLFIGSRMDTRPLSPD